MGTNPITPSTGTAAPANQSNANGLGVDSTFMKLLITQLQNQDPTQPMDPSAFVSQLVQVNSLDQLTQINQLLQQTLTNTGTPATNSGGH